MNATVTVAQADDLPMAPRVPAWYRWYFALAVLNLVTLSLCLWLGFRQAEMFGSAVTTHEVYAHLLEQIGQVRILAAETNAPGNDVFLSHDPVAESIRLEASASRFRQRYTDLKYAVSEQFDQRATSQLALYFPAIDRELTLTLSEARQVFSFMAINETAQASEHMAAMDKHNGKLGEAILAMEEVIRREQEMVLNRQHADASTVRMYGLGLAVLVVLMAIAAGVHGHRVHRAIRDDNIARERYTNSLKEARNQAEHAARIKTQFLANMSHEIRTPMNGVIGMLDALSATALTLEQAKIVKTANSSADLLLAIIDDILDFSKIEAGMLVIEKLPVDVAAVVQYIVSLYNVPASEKLIDLRFHVAPHVPKVLGDPTRLTQLLANFTSNAIKFTARGVVSISVTTLAQDNDTVRLRFAVKDSGIGIAKEAQQRLFNAFSQADNSTSRKFGGTGLGLAICRQLVHLLDPRHGEIGVTSNEGDGAEFHFVLQLPIAHGASAEPIASIRTHQTQARRVFRAKVLVAEDNDTNQQVAVALLRALGIDAVVASDGSEAVAAVQHEIIDLILMDYHMPKLDGSEATIAIREYEKNYALPRIPIIALTASVLSEDRTRCTIAGMDDFLAKPIRSQHLVAMLDKWLPNAATVQPLSEEKPMCESSQTGAATGAALPDDLFDDAQLQEMRQITGEGFAGIIRQFYGNVHAGVQAMRAACEAQDAAALKSVAHKLKGSAATIGAKQVAAHCSQLELLGKSGSVNGALAMIDQLVHAYLRAKPQLDEYAESAPDLAAGM